MHFTEGQPAVVQNASLPFCASGFIRTRPRGQALAGRTQACQPDKFLLRAFVHSLRYLFSQKLPGLVLESIKARFQRLAISDDIVKAQTIITADTSFANDKFIWNEFEQL
jgi:hypothetical protein